MSKEVFKKDGLWHVNYGTYGANHRFKFMALRNAEKMRGLVTGVMKEYKGKPDDYEFPKGKSKDE